MTTIYRDEKGKLQKYIVEDKYEYRYIGELLYMNNKRFSILNINIDNDIRKIELKNIDSIQMSIVDYRNKRGYYN